MSTLRSSTGSGVELCARSEKVNQLVNVLDKHALNSRLDPYADAERVAEAASAFTRAEWASVCRFAGCNLPSELTICAVVSIYMRRAELTTGQRVAS